MPTATRSYSFARRSLRHRFTMFCALVQSVQMTRRERQGQSQDPNSRLLTTALPRSLCGSPYPCPPLRLLVQTRHCRLGSAAPPYRSLSSFPLFRRPTLNHPNSLFK